MLESLGTLITSKLICTAFVSPIGTILKGVPFVKNAKRWVLAKLGKEDHGLELDLELVSRDLTRSKGY